MKTANKIAMLLCLFALISGCASQPIVVQEEWHDTKNNLTFVGRTFLEIGDMKEADSPVDSTFGRIVIKRAYSVLGGGILLGILDNNQLAGVVGPGGTAWWDRAPGTANLTVGTAIQGFGTGNQTIGITNHTTKTVNVTFDRLKGVQPLVINVQPNTTNYVSVSIGLRKVKVLLERP